MLRFHNLIFAGSQLIYRDFNRFLSQYNMLFFCLLGESWRARLATAITRL